MSRVVVLSAGIAGHTAASYLSTWLGKEHEVLVISPQSYDNLVPSNIWLGLGLMNQEQVTFPFGPEYSEEGINFLRGRSVELFPKGSVQNASPYVVVESHLGDDRCERADVTYDYLVIATGPKRRSQPGSRSSCAHFFPGKSGVSSASIYE